ncbi:uncharacterized protein LOC112048969 [Bicyclus anynana]|uniref:Uncharacterized protein LOC112048969 n=1 Tax=Bicyclus anynana TaxID=110368 RepID=A0A6J1N6G1_BICAN|nr:uncharacterized protein LOC112048969 [Bicyclus anynana]XP_052740578.1 uncharacterized protein LOC112048969 [Bicyclus anynana]XP_052740579.1 uncharacterized protein LOC112048969 [Bicyclus anynana]XP_052740580.1 uncharacterized protein LOC112048969 [Bicyclus anynana]
MAGNKINTKKKEDKSKSSKNVDPAMEENEDIDFSLLRKPIPTRITGFAQARKIFDLATEELKGLLSDECDLLYECKVCRNMFRSLVNFVSHKRVYCKEQFKSSKHSHFMKETSVMAEILKIKKLEESYQESLSEKMEANNMDEDDDARIPITKDLTSIIEKITKNTGVQQTELENNQLVFQKIPKSSVAVFQNLEPSNTKSDTMKAQVDELHDILSQENAVLQNDGSFKVQSSDNVEETKETNPDNVIQISDDEETEDSDILKCKICGLQFSTLKTMKFHIKYKHLENRLVYPCPDCLDIFSTSWSVYRHLFKVHRKTGAQIRRLREAIQAKAFRMNNPPTYYEKRKTLPKPAPTQKITEEERLLKENQAWFEELDGESEGRRCGGCGRTFERRAALAAHTHTCARRHRRRIQIQIRKDYHKEPNNPYMALAGGATQTPADAKLNAEDAPPVDKVQDVKDKDADDDNNDEPPEADPEPNDPLAMETDEHITRNIKPKFYDSSMINNLPYAQPIEKNNLNAFRQKMQPDVDLFKLLCKKCDVKHEKFSDFLEHMSEHYKWVRYACKLCNFKHFVFDKLPEHVKIVHKLKGNTEFYYSTVKAIDGAEAFVLSESVDEPNESNETSPNSRRPSRCSSDSSRLSDDSSSSCTRPETGSRKRKSNLYKMNAKKKKEAVANDDNNQKDDDILLVEDTTAPNNKIFEENSSDFDEMEEKSSRKNIAISTSVVSRRPVRKKTKPKNADFEYDLSNLLKLEAQGYRDSQTVCSKTVQSKKKVHQELLNNYDTINKDCLGAMITLSRKSVENAQAHMKTASFPIFKASKESRVSSFFARPMIPRMTRTDKSSPKKVETEELPNTSSLIKVIEPSSSSNSITKNITLIKNQINKSASKLRDNLTQTSAGVIKKPLEINQAETIDSILTDSGKNVEDSVSSPEKDKKITLENDEISAQKSAETLIKPTDSVQDKITVTNINKFNDDVTASRTEEHKTLNPNDEASSKSVTEIKKVVVDGSAVAKDTTVGSTNKKINMVSLKLRRQSLEVLKKPLTTKDLTDLTKSGRKTKVLVIKPFNRNAEGIKNLNAPLKFQTIKLKDASKSNSTKEDKNSDQVVVVQVPKVDCGMARSLPTNNINNKVSPLTTATVGSEKCEENGLQSQDQTLKIKEKTFDSDKSRAITLLQTNSLKMDEDQPPNHPSEEDPLGHDKDMCGTLDEDSGEHIDQKDKEQIPNNHVTNFNKDNNLNVKTLMKSNESNVQKNQINCDHTSESISESNELLLKNSHDIVS